MLNIDPAGREVRFDDGSRALYADDLLPIYRHVSVGVVVPRDADDVVATIAADRERDVPVPGRGCGTSLQGQTCNVAVVVDFSEDSEDMKQLKSAGLSRARLMAGWARKPSRRSPSSSSSSTD